MTTFTPELATGMAFPSMEEARRVIERVAVDKHLSYFAKKCDKSRSDFRCLLNRNSNSTVPACPFRIYVSRSSDSACVVREVTEHTCPAITHDQFKGQNRQRYLQPRLQALVANDRTIRPRTLANIERNQFGNDVNYKSLAKARHGILASTGDGYAGNQVRKIRPFLDAVSDSAYVDFARESTESPHFERAFVFPRACVTAFVNSSRLLSFDACNFKGRIPGHALGASFLDANNHVVTMAWGVSAVSECKEVWRLFFDFLRQSIIAECGLDPGDLAAFAGRGKGLVPAMDSVWGKMIEERRLDHMGFLYDIWRDTMTAFYERSHAPNAHPRFTDHCYGKFAVEMERSRDYVVYPASDEEAIVDYANVAGRASYLVNIPGHICSSRCSLWQDLCIPCRHVIAFLRRRGIDPESHIASCFTLEMYRQAYSGRLKAVVLSQLDPDDTLPPRQQTQPDEGSSGQPGKRKRGVRKSWAIEQRQEERRALLRAIAEENELERGTYLENSILQG